MLSWQIYKLVGGNVYVSVRIHVQDYKSERAMVVICDTHARCHAQRQLLTGDTLSSASQIQTAELRSFISCHFLIKLTHNLLSWCAYCFTSTLLPPAVTDKQRWLHSCNPGLYISLLLPILQLFTVSVLQDSIQFTRSVKELRQPVDHESVSLSSDLTHCSSFRSSLPLSPSTPSLFHSRLKTYLFHKSSVFLTFETDFTDFMTSPELN